MIFLIISKPSASFIYRAKSALCHSLSTQLFPSTFYPQPISRSNYSHLLFSTMALVLQTPFPFSEIFHHIRQAPFIFSSNLPIRIHHTINQFLHNKERQPPLSKKNGLHFRNTINTDSIISKQNIQSPLCSTFSRTSTGFLTQPDIGNFHFQQSSVSFIKHRSFFYQSVPLICSPRTYHSPPLT